MVFVGIVILLLSFYINGSSATWLFLQTIPLCYKNGYAIDYPVKMAHIGIGKQIETIDYHISRYGRIKSFPKIIKLDKR